MKKTAQPAKDDKATNDLSASVDVLKIDEGPKPKSRNLDVLAEFEKSRAKKAANFIVIGR